MDRVCEIILKKVRRLKDKAPVDVNGICGIHKGKVPPRTVIIKKSPLVRMFLHPPRCFDGNTLVGDHRIVVGGKGTRPETQDEESRQ